MLVCDVFKSVFLFFSLSLSLGIYLTALRSRKQKISYQESKIDNERKKSQIKSVPVFNERKEKEKDLTHVSLFLQ